MTVTYTAEVATCRNFGCFLTLLTRWRGSMYKLVWIDLIAFLFMYYLLVLLYYLVLTPEQKRMFENIVEYCNWQGSQIPLSFVLGFYVSIVVKRWWDQYLFIPWPDSIAVFVSAHVRGNNDRARVIRRTIMRYVTVCLVIVLVSMSPRVKKRFPTWDHYVTAGLLQESEKQIIERFHQKFPAYPKHWMPIVWSASIIVRARREGLIRDDCAVNTIVNELNSFRGSCGSLMHYDFISIPLVYTQVVTLAVYTYFTVSLMRQQPIELPATDENYKPSYFPLFTTLEFLFYMGWLKVAETMINPFGEDDDDFEVNWMIDRHLLVSYLIVDEMHHDHPELVRDQYWDEVFPAELPYANEGGAKREEPPEASTAKIGNESTAASEGRRTSSPQEQSERTSLESFQPHLPSVVSLPLARESEDTSTNRKEGSMERETLNIPVDRHRRWYNRITSLIEIAKTMVRNSSQVRVIPDVITEGPRPTIEIVPSVSSNDFERLRSERLEQRRQRREKRRFTENKTATIVYLPPVQTIELTDSEMSAEQADTTLESESSGEVAENPEKADFFSPSGSSEVDENEKKQKTKR